MFVAYLLLPPVFGICLFLIQWLAGQYFDLGLYPGQGREYEFRQVRG